MEWAEILKLYGPQAIPWIALAYFGKWHLDRLDRDLDARVKMASALEALTRMIERTANGKTSGAD